MNETPTPQAPHKVTEQAKLPSVDKDPVEANHTPRSAPWTPEPWEVSEHDKWLIVSPARGMDSVCECGGNHFKNQKENTANAQRIVTCVNALAGISNPAAVKEVIKAAQNWVIHHPAAYFTTSEERLARALADLGEHEKE